MTSLLPSRSPAAPPSARAGLGPLRDAFWRVARAATTPVLPAEYLDLLAPMRSGADLRGKVVAVTPETDGAAVVTIRPGRGWRGHRAGQYVRIGVDVDGVRCWRAYSLTSLVDARDGLLTVCVKAIPDGRVSNHVVRALQPGTLIFLDQATGDFTLPRSRRPRRCSSPAAAG